MKRWHEEIHLMINRAKSYVHKKLSLGECRKSAPYDCGNPKCTACHSDKFPKREKTNQEKRSDLDMKDDNGQ